jgi:hypothetical protein
MSVRYTGSDNLLSGYMDNDLEIYISIMGALSALIHLEIDVMCKL